MSAWDLPGRLFKLARKVEDIFQLQEETKAALRTIDRRLAEIETRMTHLEADRGQMITEAKAAAGAAASAIAGAMAGGILNDVVTRLTRLELRQADQPPRLPSPSEPNELPPMPPLS